MIEYFTKRIAPNNTEYRFVMETSDSGNVWIDVHRVRPWYKPNERILLRRTQSNLEGLKIFQTLLDNFPRDQLYKE